MNRNISGMCLAAVLGVALSASAQTTPAPQQPPTSPNPPTMQTAPPDTARMDKEAKLTGCVAAGTAPGSFQLTNAKKDGAASDKAAKSVKLSAPASVDLAAHVGHTVEVTGTWGAKSNMPTASSDSTPTPQTGQDQAGAMASSVKGEFNVASVKMVSATCAPTGSQQ